MPMYKTYMTMSSEDEINIWLTRREEAAMFAAYDYGILELDRKSADLVQDIIDKIKHEIWPDD